MEKWKKKYLGNADFYRMVLLVAVPIMIQNAITNFVSLLDNIMVGQIGTEQMSGVAIVNQLMFVFNICVFGAVSAAGIFGAQFYGKGDNNGVKEAFRFKILACVILGILWMMLFIFGGEALIKMFLHEGSDVGDIALTLRYARAYMLAVMPSMLPFALIQAYAQTLRETGETILPMKAGLISVAVNLILDYVFIFGFMGIEGMGVLGAAIATVVARIIECIIVVVWTHWKKEKNTYVIGLYKNFKISWGL
ncbi:MAG: polysaccharide biosynthesis C-terminal domain-containing protein, partial [Lachnospiraceae bacterium]|nr:polysaccharide biosynthesis C-terminal domain-containing protein [Lachnospiraceae bacterium]